MVASGVRMTGRWAALAMLGCAAAFPARADEPCPAASYRPELPLPHTRAALAADQPVVIVFIGSSSVQGWMASDAGHNMAARLQTGLASRLPHAEIAVVNRGVGGQDAPEEVARLDTDVLAVRPTMVIWQVGANGAMRGVDPTAFHDQVAAGVAHLAAAKVDILLVDNQRSPRVLAAPRSAEIDAVLAAIAAPGSSVGLFSRGRLMDAWRDAGHDYAEFVANDGLHHNDRGYACVAASMADAIARAALPPPDPSAALPAQVAARAGGN